MKKVLFLLPSMNIGGTEKALLNMISDDEFREKYDTTLLLLQKEGGFLPYVPDWVRIVSLDGYKDFEREISKSPKEVFIGLLKKGHIVTTLWYLFYHLHFRRTQDRTALWKMVSKTYPLHHDEQYDIAVSYFGPDDFLSYCALNIIHAKEKVQWIHFDVSKYVFHKHFAKKNYPKFDRIHAVSDEALRALVICVPEISVKADTYYNSISPELCLKMADEGKGYADNYNGIRILTVGRLSEEKGQDIIPEIARKLVDDGYRFKWYLIGTGNLKKTLEDKIVSFHIENNVALLGATPNPYPYYKQSSIYVQTSRHEGFGLSVAEAKLFGLEVVAAEVTGAHEQLDSYSKGTIVNHSVKEFTAKLEEIMCNYYGENNEYAN